MPEPLADDFADADWTALFGVEFFSVVFTDFLPALLVGALVAVLVESFEADLAEDFVADFFEPKGDFLEDAAERRWVTIKFPLANLTKKAGAKALAKALVISSASCMPQ